MKRGKIIFQPSFFRGYVSFQGDIFWLPSLKLTAKAPENRPNPKRNKQIVFQPSISGAKVMFVSGRARYHFVGCAISKGINLESEISHRGL